MTIVDTWREHVDAINQHGLRIVGYGGDRAIRCGRPPTLSSVGAADVVLFQCKAFANEAAAKSVRHLFDGTSVAITFQNGLGNEETLGRRARRARTCSAGSRRRPGRSIEPGVVRNFGDLPTYVGELAGGLSHARRAIADAFTRHGLPTHASADIKRDKWKKLLGNVALGAISAATDMTSADMVAVPELRAVVLRALDEAAAVARACGIALDDAEKRGGLRQAHRPLTGGGTGSSKSSMAADIAAPPQDGGRHDPRHRWHGCGREHGVPTPTIDAMIGIVKGLEARNLKGGALTMGEFKARSWSFRAAAAASAAASRWPSRAKARRRCWPRPRRTTCARPPT